MTVSAILKGIKDSYGRKKVYIRINDGNRRTFFATQIKVTPEQFEKGKVKDHKDAKLYNENIRTAIVAAENKRLEGTSRYPDADFRKYMIQFGSVMEKQRADSTLGIYKTEGEKLLAFTGDIKMSRVTVDLLERYRSHLFNQDYDSNTVWKSLKTLRTVFNYAATTGIIRESPFKVFKLHAYKEGTKSYLTEADLVKLEQYLESEECPKQFVFWLNWFLIGCYTGLRYSDMIRFDEKKHIVGGRLVMLTHKTKDIVGLPVKGKIKELFDRVEFKKLNLSNQKFNEYLKVIAEGAEVDAHLTVHVSRHTFAMRCANAGISPEVTARLMGAKSLKTVATYYKISNSRIDSEIDKII